MYLEGLGRMAVLLGMALVLATSAFVPADAAQKNEEKPYRIVGGKVDFGTYNGYRRYHNSCHRCHGPDAVGSSFAPSLMESLRELDEEQFLNIVVNGRIDGRIGNSNDNTPSRPSSAAGEKNVMPSFGLDPNVMEYLDDLYGYIKARSDGVLGPGRPARLPKEKVK
jgi:mono/diheme cytochrome c family protein